MDRINQYMTVGEAADFLGVSKDTLRRWDRAGKLAARRHPVTGYRLYLKGDLEHVLKQIARVGSSGSPRRHRKKGKGES